MSHAIVKTDKDEFDVPIKKIILHIFGSYIIIHKFWIELEYSDLLKNSHLCSSV